MSKEIKWKVPGRPSNYKEDCYLDSKDVLSEESASQSNGNLDNHLQAPTTERMLLNVDLDSCQSACKYSSRISLFYEFISKILFTKLHFVTFPENP